MDRRLVTIARFPSLVGADLARSRLEADGIPSFLTGEFGAATAGGSVGLQVPDEYVEDARRVLELDDDEVAPESVAAPSDVYCPICRSGSPLPVPPPLPLRVLYHALGLLLPIPSDWFAGRRVRCAVCSHEWLPDAGETDRSRIASDPGGRHP